MIHRKKAIIVSTILIGLGGFYIFKNMKLKSPIASPVNDEQSTVGASTLDTTKILSKGSTGFEVKMLQKALKGGLVVDGNFGALTEKRLKAITGKTSITIREYNAILSSK